MNGSVVVELGMRTSQGAPYASAECVSSLTALTMHLPTTVCPCQCSLRTSPATISGASDTLLFLSHVTCKVMPGRHEHLAMYVGEPTQVILSTTVVPAMTWATSQARSSLNGRRSTAFATPKSPSFRSPETGRARYGVEARGKGLQATEPVYC